VSEFLYHFLDACVSVLVVPILFVAVCSACSNHIFY